MRLRYSRKFEIDLERIGDYLRKEASARTAELFVQRVRRSCRDLLDQPLAYPIWQQRPDLGLRRRIVGRYLVFYRVTAGVVELARIVHGARDIEDAIAEA